MRDLVRLKNEYTERSTRLAGNNRYSPFNSAHLFLLQQRQRATLQLFKKQGILSLKNQRVLEVGCGGGAVFPEYLGYGISLSQLHGTDLLFDRLQSAQYQFQSNQLTQANAQYLPYKDASFDIILQYMMFSSLLDADLRLAIAHDIRRVLRPSGFIIWYDFWLNPRNQHTVGLGKSEVRRLFPNCTYQFKRVTLAPPLARRIVPFSWTVARLLEKINMFNSHHLVIIRPINV